MKANVDYTLYLCTDRALMSTETVEESVRLALQGGCTVVQLREKDCSALEFYEMACRVKRVTDDYKVPLIINDRVDIALAVDAAGVHVGQGDIPAKEVRRIIGPNKILGVSASTCAEAVKAVQDGADYLGVGAMFATGTKTDANLTPMKELIQIREAVRVPIVVIGGINRETAPLFTPTGVNGIAVVSAIIASHDIPAAARELKHLFLNGRVEVLA